MAFMIIKYILAGFYHMDFIFAVGFFRSNWLYLLHDKNLLRDIPAAACVSYRNYSTNHPQLKRSTRVTRV